MIIQDEQNQKYFRYMRAFSQMVESGDYGVVSTNRMQWQDLLYKSASQIDIEEVLKDNGITDIIENECD